MDDILASIQDKSIIAWIENNGIKTDRGTPFDFEQYAFMIDPFNDWTPMQGTRKASQCGWSLMTNTKLIYAARYGIPGYGIPAANVIYTLPSDSDVNMFVPSKTNMIIKHNPIIESYTKDENGNKRDVDSIQRKQIGNSMVYFKGTRSKTAAIMLTADLLIHDESDRSEQHIVEEYESRTSSSLYKGRWVFSNPSAPNMPADLMYLDSDQKHWFIKCVRCGHWQYLDWYKLSEYEFSKQMHCFVDDVNGVYICSGCAAPISNDNRKRGRWVKKIQNSQISGYWVTHFMYSWIAAKQLVNTEKKKSKSYFMNFVRGLPYVGSDVVIDSQSIVSNIVLTQKTYTRGRVAMGVDNGDQKHYVIGDAEGIFEIGKTRDWNHIELLIKKYDPVTVIDLNPYPNKPRELAGKYRRVYCSFYILQSQNYELIDWGQKDKKFMVYPVRDLLFDDLIAYISSGNIKFFNPKSYWEEYIAHWETMYRADMVGTRKAEEISASNPNKIVQGKWVSSNGNDHYAHATLYYYVALSKIIQGSGKVITDHDSISEVAQAVGGVKITPQVRGGESNTTDRARDLIKRSLRQQMNPKKSTAVSGNM